MLQQTIQQNKQSKQNLLNRHVQKKINNVEYYVTLYKGIKQRLKFYSSLTELD